MRTPDQIDYEQSYDFNPYAPAMPKADETLDSQGIDKLAQQIKRNPRLDSDDDVSCYLGDLLLELDINCTMARQMLGALGIEANDYLTGLLAYGDPK